MRNLAIGLDFRPPDTPVTKANTVMPQRLGDDHMMHFFGVEIAFFRQVGHAPKAARLLVSRARYFDSARKIRANRDEGFGGNDARRQPALHVTGPAPVNLAVDDLAAKRISGPAAPHFHDVDVGIEVHTFPAARPLFAGHNVPARIAIRIAQSTLGADEFRMETIL